jgi:cytochrome P450 RapN
MAMVTDELLAYPFATEVGLDVDPGYRALQQRGPVRVQLAHGAPCWLATRYDDVRTVFVDRRFSREYGYGREDVPRMWSGPIMVDPSFPLGMDPPRHTRLRRLTSPAFSPQRVRNLQSWVQGIVDGLLDGMAAAGPPVDFVAAFTWDLPVTVLTGILGVPTEDMAPFREWVAISTDFKTPPEVRAATQEKSNAFIADLIADRRAHPADDLLSVLVQARDAEDRLDEAELLSLCNSLLAGGFKTTAMQLGMTLYALMTHREHWQELVEDPGLLPAAVEELWRWIPAFKYGTPFPRWALEDVELSEGAVVRAGEAVLAEHSVANRDESVFPDAWTLDFHRPNPRPHLALGFGEHFCMGAHLANIQVTTTLASLLERHPTLELAIPADDVEWPSPTFMRSVGALPLRW